MITPNNPLGTPGFFQQAVFPVMPSILPGTVDMGPGSMPQLPQGNPQMQAQYVQQIMVDMMASMQDLQKSFAMYLGTPPGGPIGPTGPTGPTGPQAAPAAPAAPKK